MSLPSSRVHAGSGSVRRSKTQYSPQQPPKNAYTPVVRDNSQLTRSRLEQQLEKNWVTLGAKKLEGGFESEADTASLRSRSASVDSRVSGRPHNHFRGSSLERRQQYDRKRSLLSGVEGRKHKESQQEAARWAVFCSIRDAVQGSPELGIKDGKIAQRPREPNSPERKEELERYEKALLRGLRRNSKSQGETPQSSPQRRVRKDKSERERQAMMAEFALQEQQKGRRWSSSPPRKPFDLEEKLGLKKNQKKKTKKGDHSMRKKAVRVAAGESTPTNSSAASPSQHSKLSSRSPSRPHSASSPSPVGAFKFTPTQLQPFQSTGVPPRGLRLNAEFDPPKQTSNGKMSSPSKDVIAADV